MPEGNNGLWGLGGGLGGTTQINGNVLQTTASNTFTVTWDAANWAHWERAFQTPPDIPAAPDPEDTEMLHVVNKFKVGCDPEFLFVDKQTGAIRNASDFLPANGPVGYDHGGRVAEFRPAPSRMVARVIKHLDNLINDDERLVRAKPLKWRAGGIYHNTHTGHNETLGGHVHFDIPYVPRNQYDVDGNRIRQGDGAVMREVEACDALTRAFEHLDILPTRESAARRRTGGYGRFGDIRECHGHLEYRTPLSWLHKPETAFFVLTGYKLAAAAPKSLPGPTHLATVAGLFDFYRSFAADDDDARRVVDKLNLKKVQGDPDADFKLFWESRGI